MGSKIDKTIEGRIVDIGSVEVVGNGMKVQRVVVEESCNDIKYPESASIAFFEKSLPFVNKCKVGDFVKVWFKTTARQSNGRWFNNINGWKIELLASGKPVEPEPEPEPRPEPRRHHESIVCTEKQEEPDEDNLPF